MLVIRTIFRVFERCIVPESLRNQIDRFIELQALVEIFRSLGESTFELFILRDRFP